MTNSLLRDIIDELKCKMPDNIFIQFLESLENNDFGADQNREYLKKEYSNAMEFYKKVMKENEN